MDLKRILSVFILLFSLASNGQDIKPKDWKKHLVLEAKKDSIAMQLAIKNKDYQTAASLSYQLMVNDQKNIGKLYQLARIYYAAKQFDLTINTCGQILSIDSLNQESLVLAASSFSNLKQFSNALVTYQRLYEVSKDPNYLYQMALIQFENKQPEECLKVLSAIVNDTTSNSRMIDLSSVNEEGKNVKQSIPLNAAAYNIVGFIYSEKKDFKGARKYYGEALKISPKFNLAKNNLADAVLKENQAVEKK